MSVAKIRLSKKETGLVTDADWILTKNGIIAELVRFLSDWQGELADVVTAAPLLVEGWQHSAPKISRGENYQGLPWVVLDYPRAFAHPGFAAIRVMFWWGRFFSITLHASGNFKTALEKRLAPARSSFAEKGFHLCVQPGEWDHSFTSENYRHAADMTDGEWSRCLAEKGFLKLAMKIPLGDFDALPGILEKQFRFLVEACRA